VSLGAQALGEAVRAESDRAGLRPIEVDAPAVVRAVEQHPLILDAFAVDAIDRHGVQRRLVPAGAPVHGDLEIRDAMERQRRRGDAERRAFADAADPLDDEVDVERQVARPVGGVGIAGLEDQPPDVAVVPGEALEVGVSLHRGHAECYGTARRAAITKSRRHHLPQPLRLVGAEALQALCVTVTDN
jgi:hypothetical protein